MTAPQEERENARAEATAAITKAQEVRSRGARIAAGWAQSRHDNNFRMMLRAIAAKADSSAN